MYVISGQEEAANIPSQQAEKSVQEKRPSLHRGGENITCLNIPVFQYV